MHDRDVATARHKLGTEGAIAVEYLVLTFVLFMPLAAAMAVLGPQMVERHMQMIALLVYEGP